VRIATWNVNSLKVRLPRVEEWLGYAQPDVLCLQETKVADTAFPSLAFSALGYEAAHHGEGQWNGVAILSRVGLADARPGFLDDDLPDPEARLLWATCGGVRLASVYVPNGRGLDQDHFQYKLDFLARLRRSLEVGCDPNAPLAVCGDFNIAPTDDDVWNPAAFEGATHVSPAERAALDELKAWGLQDAFRRHRPESQLFTWWDYRAGMFHKHQGMRIDLVLASAPLAEHVTFALIDRQARKGKLPSDHAPLVIDVDVEPD
jgi:exodeoxyribonuclease III